MATELTLQNMEGEVRVLDLELAQQLEFAKPTKIRELIGRYRAALEQMGPLPTVGRVINGGEATEFYLNKKQSIFITAKSKTAKATEITIDIIERFDAYERGEKPAAAPALTREEQIAYALIASQQIVTEQRAKIERLEPKALAHDRIADADGTLCITDAAKTLQVGQKVLFSYMRGHRWIYSRPGTSDIAHQDKINSGLLAHKVTAVQRPDGTEKIATQVRVTPKGLTRLAAALNQPSAI